MTTKSNTHLSSVPAIEGRIQDVPVIIIGAGQAGLSISYCLQQKGIEHLILEKSSQIASNWRNERWDAFCLVTPNWQCQLPGHPYQGDDPHGFMVKDQIVDYIQSYYDAFKPTVQFNTPVEALTRVGNRFYLHTGTSTFRAQQVVLACGSYHHPNILPFAKYLPNDLHQVHSRDYKNPEQLPEGAVMVVGTGQSGCQIAEDLHLQGRKVHLSVGSAPRVNRFYRGRDVVDWLEDMGYYETTIDRHPDGEAAPHNTNHYVTGRDGGRDLNLRIFAEEGMELYGTLKYISGNNIEFCDDLHQNLLYADEVAARIRESIESYIQEKGIAAPEDTNVHSEYLPEMRDRIDLGENNIRSVVWATGFKMDFDWVKLPVINERGHPRQERGVTPVPGLYFLGLNWMHTWGSGRFFHIGRDAQFISEQIEDYYLKKNKLSA